MGQCDRAVPAATPSLGCCAGPRRTASPTRAHPSPEPDPFHRRRSSSPRARCQPLGPRVGMDLLYAGKRHPPGPDPRRARPARHTAPWIRRLSIRQAHTSSRPRPLRSGHTPGARRRQCLDSHVPHPAACRPAAAVDDSKQRVSSEMTPHPARCDTFPSYGSRYPVKTARDVTQQPCVGIRASKCTTWGDKTLNRWMGRMCPRRRSAKSIRSHLYSRPREKLETWHRRSLDGTAFIGGFRLTQPR